jgi:hypothetical protein
MTTWKQVPVEEQARLADLYKQKMPLHLESERLGISLTSLERYIRQFIYHESLFTSYLLSKSMVNKQAPAKVYDDFEELTGDDFMIISDLEIPDHSPEFLSLVLLSATARKIKTLVIAGDMVATDHA